MFKYMCWKRVVNIKNCEKPEKTVKDCQRRRLLNVIVKLDFAPWLQVVMRSKAYIHLNIDNLMKQSSALVQYPGQSVPERIVAGRWCLCQRVSAMKKAA